MPELRCTRSRWLGLAWALSMSLLSPVEAADPVPAGLRACGAEADAQKRLACFDRELARYPAPAPKATAKRDAAAPAANANAGTTAAESPTPAGMASGSAAAAESLQHVSARIVGIDPAPNEMVLHLDNGQVWQQVQGVSGDLSLRPGDTVTIEKHLGSYWLSGPHVANMKVRQKS